MTPEAMLQMLSQPEILSQVSLQDLKLTLETYPCFAMAQMLYVKALKEQGDLDYPQELFKSSLQAPSRRQLYYCIRGGKPLLHETDANDYFKLDGPDAMDGPENLQVSETDDFAIIDKFLESRPQDNGTLQYDTPMSEVPLYDIEEALGDGSDVEEDNEVIRRFMESSATSDLAVSGTQMEDEESAMPESAFTLTLARIYLRQKKYAQALEIFRSLVLKNPEKSIYFADQIRYLEKVINNLNQ